ncbi:MAG TPA: hypothetical protein VIH99_04035 [Bdellovibrionota bacterium]
MSWRTLLALPLSAWLLGETLRPPRLEARLPLHERRSGCDYPWAMRTYLQAYARKEERRRIALQLLHAAESERRLCKDDTTLLRERIEGLRKILSP